jgi:hypothetical protein
MEPRKKRENEKRKMNDERMREKDKPKYLRVHWD